MSAPRDSRRADQAPRLAPGRSAPRDRQQQLSRARPRAHQPVRLGGVLESSAEWSRSCGSFDVPVGKAALSHHFSVLRGAGLVEQRDEGPRRVNRLRRAEFEARFPGLLALVLRAEPR
ncbi:ArsR/SmtB family transcription factor [Streptomyces sp. NPDC058579]|uniref:ArsR/SmtB family transcription factor n=1 Tax=Streptomyces sp. NPDC058579 TaxID=3346548 RepID=UPI003657C0C4